MTQDSLLQNRGPQGKSPVSAFNPVEKLLPSARRTILWAGVIAGTLDLTDAFVFSGIRGIGPGSVLRYIAGGLLGPTAFKSGVGTMALGAFCHYTIAFTAAAVFYAASRKIRFLIRRPIAAGLLYGCAVYAFMNFVVVPASALPHRPMPTRVSLVNGVLAILFLVGLPISLIVHRNSSLGR
jgi:hypothetical protein